ncbi:MAG: transcriptional regulator [Methanoculleus sp.]|jgi:ATP-dependent DNA helicase RecG|nr:transcriptional regulator [Methanoculleus sp.]
MRGCAELLLELNTYDEHWRIEAKEMSRTLGKTTTQTISAFSNEPGIEGGYLLLGVSRDPASGNYRVIGVHDPDKLQREVASLCASAFNRPLRPNVQVCMVDEKPTIVVYIPEEEPHNKPIYIKAQGLPRGAYRRIGSTAQRCTDEDIRMFHTSAERRTFDESVIPGALLDDIDPHAIDEYRRARRTANPHAPELNWDDRDLLLALKCADKQDNEIIPTLAGIILFGKDIAIRKYLPLMRVDYLRVPTHKWNGEISYSLEFREPLLRMIPRVIAGIMDDIPRSVAFHEGSVQRHEKPLIPERVIREAVVNALMHRNYRSCGTIQIIRYPGRLEITNPGHSLVEIGDEGSITSVTRNPAIAAILHDTNLAENKGSGIRMMVQLTQEARLSPPVFESNRQDDYFRATFSLHHFFSEEELAWLRGFSATDLSDEEAMALVFARRNGSVSNEQCRDLTGLDVIGASKLLGRLRDLGFLIQHPHGAMTFYTPTGQLGVISARTISFQETDIPLDADKTLSVGPEIIPPDIAESIRDLGKRSPSQEVRRVIIQICNVRPFSAEEIAQMIGRSKKWVSVSYLQPMVRDGQLEYAIPGEPNHPEQKYMVRRSQQEI